MDQRVNPVACAMRLCTLRRACMSVAALLVAMSAIAQQPQGRQGLGGLLGDMPSLPGGDEKNAAPVSTPAATPGETRIDLQRKIDDLKHWVAENERITVATIEPLEDLETARRVAARYRSQVDRTRRLVYVPDPPPESRAARDMADFQRRWGDLAQPILRGEAPQTPLAPERWARHVQGVSKLHCADRVALLAPPGGMPMVGWAWTCLSDRYFHELAGLRARVSKVVTSARHERTARLEANMQAVEKRLSALSPDAAEVPSPGLLVRELSQSLHKVRLEAARVHIRELEARRDDPEGAPALRSLLGAGAPVLRPLGGEQATVAASEGATITVKLGDARTHAKVEVPERTRLARQLLGVHYQLALLGPGLFGSDPTRDGLESERARLLAAIAAQAR